MVKYPQSSKTELILSISFNAKKSSLKYSGYILHCFNSFSKKSHMDKKPWGPLPLRLTVTPHSLLASEGSSWMKTGTKVEELWSVALT